MNSRYTLRPRADLPIIYLYRHAVDFRRYVLNNVLR